VTTIHKYTLEITDEQILTLPYGARLLHVDMQMGQPRLWALVDTEAVKQDRFIRIFGTGNPIEAKDLDRLVHIGTFQDDRHMLPAVWHVFEEHEDLRP
jgi:hypothetical protein